MTLQALLVSTDDSAADVLARILPAFGSALDGSSNTETAIARIEQQKFDALLLDFGDATTADCVLQEPLRIGSGQLPVTVALVADTARVRDILTGGAHFVLHKPLSEKVARAGLRAMVALLSRERRRAFRAPLQLPVELTLQDTRKVEGILLDLSQTGMAILTAEPQLRGDRFGFGFQLPHGSLQIEGSGRVAWANPNGQTGVHFIELPEHVSEVLKNCVHAAAVTASAGPDETVPHCKFTDLTLGGCYAATAHSFPEHCLCDLCLKAEEMEVHTEGMVRVSHPGHGMGLEFPSRTPEHRAQVS